MEKTQHTEAPWTVTLLDPAPEPGFAYAIGNDPLGHSGAAWPVALAITPADAELIAAAPTMLARLTNILIDCENWRADTVNAEEAMTQIEAEVRHAIAKVS